MDYNNFITTISIFAASLPFRLFNSLAIPNLDRSWAERVWLGYDVYRVQWEKGNRIKAKKLDDVVLELSKTYGVDS
jgi:hypothetical protein